MDPAPQPSLRTEQQLQMLIDSVRDYAIFLLDSRGRIITWNQGAQRIKGYTFDEIRGRHFSVFYPREDIESGKPEYELKVAAQEGRFAGIRQSNISCVTSVDLPDPAGPSARVLVP